MTKFQQNCPCTLEYKLEYIVPLIYMDIREALSNLDKFDKVLSKASRSMEARTAYIANDRGCFVKSTVEVRILSENRDTIEKLLDLCLDNLGIPREISVPQQERKEKLLEKKLNERGYKSNIKSFKNYLALSLFGQSNIRPIRKQGYNWEENGIKRKRIAIQK